jgi:peptide/nickel transport system substrate-binding protein
MELQETPQEHRDLLSNNESVQSDKKSRKKLILISFFIVIIIAAISFGVLWWLQHKTSESVAKTETSKDIPKLTIATLDGPLNIFFPDILNVNNTFYVINNNVAEGLVAYEDQTKIVPRLATSWTNPDETTWRFKLKKGVTFHTGRTMTADDVVYSINKSKEPGSQSLYNVYNNTISSVKSISPYEVEIKTDEPDAVLLNKLSLLFIIDSKGNYNAANGGTGAYIIKPGTTPTEDKVDFVAFDKYHGGKPTTRQLSFMTVDSEKAAIDAVKDGKANIGGDISSDGLPLIDTKSNKVKKIEGNSVTYLNINTVKPNSPLQKKEVRQALRLALNIDKVITSAGLDATPASQMVPSTIPGYNPSLVVAKHDIDKAKQLLTSAGYPNGFTINFTFTDSGNDKVSEEIKNQLAAINVKTDNVKMSATDFDAFYEAIASGKTDIAILGYSSDTYDALDVYEGVYIIDKTYRSDTLDDYMEKARTTFDSKKRLQILKDIAAFADEETIVIPMFIRNYYWLMDKANYNLPRDINNQGLGVFYWKATLQ